MKKLLVSTISRLFPNAVLNYAYKNLTNPQVKKLRDYEIEILDQSYKERIRFYDFDIQLYTWPGGENKILLIHGWEGQAGNFADIIIRLQAQQYTIYAFDAPSHGFSSRGKTSLFEFTELVGLLIRKYAVSRLMSHSFGGVATTYALYRNQDLHIDKYVLLTTPDKFRERINDVCTDIGVTDKVRDLLIARMERETGLSVDVFNVSNFVQAIKVNSALIIHDKNDKVIPMYRSYNVFKNWSSCTHEVVEGTGHFRILRTHSVIDRALDFLK
jgi:hypothetical protein